MTPVKVNLFATSFSFLFSSLQSFFNFLCRHIALYFCEGNYFILIILFQHTHQIPLHILIDFAVAGEGAAAFFVAAEGSDQVRVLDLFVEVADKTAAGQVGRCNLVERTDFLFAGGWIIDYNRTGKAGGKEHLLDSNIVFLLQNQRKEFIEWLVLIYLEDFVGAAYFLP